MIQDLQQQIRILKGQVEYYEDQREDREEKDEEEKKMAAAKEKKQHIQGRVLQSAVAGKTNHVIGRHTQTNNTFKESLASSIDEAVNFHSRMGPERIGQLISDVLWDAADGAAQPMLLKKSFKHIRETMYTAHGVLKARDITGAALNDQGLEVLRTVQTKNEKYFRGSLLPCSADVDRCKKIVERFGDKVVPFKYEQTKFGEGIRFDMEKALRAIIGAYGLTGAARIRRIRLAQATDGFQVTKKTTLMMGGVKMQDAGGVCSISGLPIFSEDPNDTNAQSRNHHFPLEFFIAKETKESMQLHRPMGEYLRDCGDEATNPLTGFMPLDIAVNSDLSGTWKLLETGGPMKVSRLPCINCAILSDDCHKPHSTRCSRWCQQLHIDKVGWKCYHHEMNTPERVVVMQEEMLEVSEMLTVGLEELDKKTKFPKREDPDIPGLTSITNPKSIHYVPQTVQEKRGFSKYITDELLLRDLPISGDLEVRKDRLVKQLRAKRQARNLSFKIAHATPAENALFMMMQAVPCILHCSNRTNLKILFVLLSIGLNHCINRKILQEHAGLAKRIERFVSDVESIVNSAVLGTERDPCQWHLPVIDGTPKDQTKIGPITMDNNRTVRIANQLELLIDYCIPETVDADINMKWKRCIPHYRNAMKKLRQKTDFTDDDISEFQNEFDSFYQDWVGMYGYRGVTNYIHIMSSGHMSDYLHKYRNLYLHSQQGWESLNNLMKQFFFRCTARGGGKYGKSKLKPLARWLQRRLVWLCGYTWEEMVAYDEEEKAKEAAAKSNIPQEEEDIDSSDDEEDEDIFTFRFDEDNEMGI
jgi:hypothetical protein